MHFNIFFGSLNKSFRTGMLEFCQNLSRRIHSNEANNGLFMVPKPGNRLSFSADRVVALSFRVVS